MKRIIIITIVMFLFVSSNIKAQNCKQEELFRIELESLGGSSCFLSVCTDEGKVLLYSVNKNILYLINPEGKIESSFDFSIYNSIKEIDVSFDNKVLLKAQDDECIYSYDFTTSKIQRYEYSKPEDWYVLKNPIYKEIFEDITWIPYDYYSENKRKDLGTRFDYGVNLFVTPDTVVYSLRYKSIMKIYDGNFYCISRENIWLSKNISSSSKLLAVKNNNFIYLDGRKVYVERIKKGNAYEINVKIKSPCEKVFFNQGCLKTIEVKDGYLIVNKINIGKRFYSLFNS